MSTQSPKCRLCGHRHRLGAPHVWDTEEKEKGITIKKVIEKCVHKANKQPEKRVHNEKKAEDVYTIRNVSIRQLRANLAQELRELPFDIVRNGTVIARVTKP